jgi:hypothetical protein
MASIGFSGDTSGLISVTAPLVAGSGVLTLPTGTDTLVGKATVDTLTNKSIAATQLTGTIAAAALPAGSVLQVVNGTYSTEVTSTTSTYITTGLTASITPRSISSKILVFVSANGLLKVNNTSIGFRLYRGAGSIFQIETLSGYTATATGNAFGSVSTSYLDSPATTSSTTYTLYFQSASNISIVYINGTNAGPSTSTITLMEIQG